MVVLLNVRECMLFYSYSFQAVYGVQDGAHVEHHHRYCVSIDERFVNNEVDWRVCGEGGMSCFTSESGLLQPCAMSGYSFSIITIMRMTEEPSGKGSNDDYEKRNMVGGGGLLLPRVGPAFSTTSGEHPNFVGNGCGAAAAIMGGSNGPTTRSLA